jgi:glycosyltransferase involved in cell wall biosynthesis
VRKPVTIYIESTPLLDDRLSGIGHSLQSIVREISSRSKAEGFRVVLLAPFDKMRRLKDRTVGLNVDYKPLPLPARGLYMLWKFNLVPPLDLFLGRGIYIFPNFRNWRLARSRSLTYVHDVVHVVFPEFVSPPNRRFLQKNMPKWLRQTDRVIAVSEHTRQDIIREYGCRDSLVEVIYNGVDLKEFYLRPQSEIAAARKKYGLPAKYIMFFSTIEPRKNVDGLLEAYRRLPAGIRNGYGLLLVGSAGWLVDDTVRHIEKMQAEGFNIIWPSRYVPDDDLPALLSGAAALVHPAFYEGFGISPLQAMACRVPVVAARNSSIPEVVGKAGLYFEGNKTDDMAARIRQLLMDSELGKELADAGYRQAKQFTWQRSVDRLVDTIMSEAEL